MGVGGGGGLGGGGEVGSQNRANIQSYMYHITRGLNKSNRVIIFDPVSARVFALSLKLRGSWFFRMVLSKNEYSHAACARYTFQLLYNSVFLLFSFVFPVTG